MDWMFRILHYITPPIRPSIGGPIDISYLLNIGQCRNKYYNRPGGTVLHEIVPSCVFNNPGSAESEQEVGQVDWAGGSLVIDNHYGIAEDADPASPRHWLFPPPLYPAPIKRKGFIYGESMKNFQLHDRTRGHNVPGSPRMAASHRPWDLSRRESFSSDVFATKHTFLDLFNALIVVSTVPNPLPWYTVLRIRQYTSRCYCFVVFDIRS